MKENDPFATKAILDGLISFARQNAPSAKLNDTIRDDLRTVSKKHFRKEAR